MFVAYELFSWRLLAEKFELRNTVKCALDSWLVDDNATSSMTGGEVCRKRSLIYLSLGKSTLIVLTETVVYENEN